jgi:cytosine deaminase
LIGAFDGHGRLAVGAPARLIVFNARTINEIVSRPQSDRVVIREGGKISTLPPDYSELWEDAMTAVRVTA